MQTRVKFLQHAVVECNADAWLFYDFRRSNELAWDILGVPDDSHCTRQWFVLIPEDGEPVKIVHKLETLPLSHLEIREELYDSYESLQQALRTALAPYRIIAMEYSPMNAIPVVSRVSAGVTELITSFGKHVVSSADMLSVFSSVLTENQIFQHADTTFKLQKIIFDTFRFVLDKLNAGALVTEYDAATHIISAFESQGLIADSSPVCAIGINAVSPHYFPTYERSSIIEREQIFLIDAWTRPNNTDGIYADLTYVAYTGSSVPDELEKIFVSIVESRDAAIRLVSERFRSQLPVFGFEVDNEARNVIETAGFGKYFIHRTGHSITTVPHGPGVNMDGFETHDTRRVIPGTIFSIEPGIYIPEYVGMRSEINVVVHLNGLVDVPAQPLQNQLLQLG